MFNVANRPLTIVDFPEFADESDEIQHVLYIIKIWKGESENGKNT